MVGYGENENDWGKTKREGVLAIEKKQTRGEIGRMVELKNLACENRSGETNRKAGYKENYFNRKNYAPPLASAVIINDNIGKDIRGHAHTTSTLRGG